MDKSREKTRICAVNMGKASQGEAVFILGEEAGILLTGTPGLCVRVRRWVSKEGLFVTRRFIRVSLFLKQGQISYEVSINVYLHRYSLFIVYDIFIINMFIICINKYSPFYFKNQTN